MKRFFYMAIGLIPLALLLVAAVVKISEYPAVTTPASTDLFVLASGSTNKNITYANLKAAINLTNIDGAGHTSTIAIWVDANTLTNLVNGSGFLTNDGAGNFGFTTNITQDITINNVNATNLTVVNSLTVSNFYTVNGSHNTLIVTNYVRMPWTTLTLSGTNVSAIDFSAGSMFKLTITGDDFVGAPSNLPGTNRAQIIQLHVAQDSTGGRTLTLTNGSWVVAGSGTSTNAVIGLTTNANAVTILTFSTSPFSATKVYAVVAATGP